MDVEKTAFGENGEEWIGTAEAPNEDSHCESLVFIIFRDLRHSPVMFTSLEVEIKRVICIELFQTFDVT